MAVKAVSSVLRAVDIDSIELRGCSNGHLGNRATVGDTRVDSNIQGWNQQCWLKVQYPFVR